ncbi:MAG: Flp pilus assembly protein CpaB [Geminicoccaceae bacterium]|nr:Flp pilus assembly protein CpaB [Geminicoccaceae bacterium]
MKRLLSLFFSVVFAVVSTYAIKMMLEGREKVSIAEAKPSESKPTVVNRVLIAKRKLTVGSFISDADVGWQDWPDIEVPQSFIVNKVGEEAKLYGSVVRNPIAAGQPLTLDNVVDPSDRSFLSAILEPGMRAITVPMDEAGGNTGLIFPGDYVDVILTQSINNISYDEKSYKKSTTILTNQKVIAIGRRLSEQEKGESKSETARTVTLEATPEHAQEIALAMDLGRLTLALRSLASTETGNELYDRESSFSNEENTAKNKKVILKIIRGNSVDETSK